MSFARLRTITTFTVILGAVSFWPVSFWPMTPAMADDGFVDVFNGKDFTGWVVDGSRGYKQQNKRDPVWTVDHGMIVCSGRGGGFLRYDKKLTDFIMRIEFRMDKGCNSGLGIRGVEFTGPRKTRPSTAGYEVQILNDAGKAPSKHSSGALYRYLAPKTNATRPAGQWNAAEIECRGPKIRITFNGQILHDVDQSTIRQIKNKPLAGYFSVQDHGKRIEFRNVKLKEL